MKFTNSLVHKTVALMGVAVAALTLVGTASAASTTTLYLTDVKLADGSLATGDIVLSSTGSVLSGNLEAEGHDFDIVGSIDNEGIWGLNLTEIGIRTANYLYLTIDVPVGNLAGYVGGNICTQSSQCYGEATQAELGSNSSVNAVSGSLSLTAPSSAAPEPGTNALLGGGLVVAGLAARKRFAK